MRRGGEHVAERFEVFFDGSELANGYHELNDGGVQRERFEEANRKRLAMGKKVMPLDEKFLCALDHEFPDCCGVAVGFDRLMMKRHGVKSIEEVQLFSWR